MLAVACKSALLMLEAGPRNGQRAYAVLEGQRFLLKRQSSAILRLHGLSLSFARLNSGVFGGSLPRPRWETTAAWHPAP